MKTFATILSIILLVTCLGCQPAAQAEPTPDVSELLPKPGETSMKGYELYSWQQDGQWVFSLLLGTNREKTMDEIKSPQAMLTLATLKNTLASLPAGESILWLEKTGLELPSTDTITEIQYFCLERQLKLLFLK